MEPLEFHPIDLVYPIEGPDGENPLMPTHPPLEPNEDGSFTIPFDGFYMVGFRLPDDG